jgi:hypothetical protein
VELILLNLVLAITSSFVAARVYTERARSQDRVYNKDTQGYRLYRYE